MLLGAIGPLLGIAAAALMVAYGWPTSRLLYPGLVLMVAVLIWALVSPPRKLGIATNNDSAGWLLSVK